MSTTSPLSKPRAAGKTMMAVVTTGVGGYDRLVVSQVPVPAPVQGEVFVQVLAAGMDNTEINTRLDWYSSSVTTGTADASVNVGAQASTRPDGAGIRSPRSP